MNNDEKPIIVERVDFHKKGIVLSWTEASMYIRYTAITGLGVGAIDEDLEKVGIYAADIAIAIHTLEKRSYYFILEIDYLSELLGDDVLDFNKIIKFLSDKIEGDVND